MAKKVTHFRDKSKRAPGLASARRLIERLVWKGRELELFAVVPPALLLSQITGIKHEFDVELKPRWVMAFSGVLLLDYGTPLLLLFRSSKTAWLCLAIFGTALLALAYNASTFFKPPGFLEIIRWPVADARKRPGFVFTIWVARYLNCAYFFGILDYAIQIISHWRAYKTQAGAGGGLFDMFYFSFSTITTLGYGDIVPASNVAKLMAVAETLGGMWIILICVVGSLGFLFQSGSSENK